MTQVDHTRMANAIRGLAMDAVEKAKSGHPGAPMGLAPLGYALLLLFGSAMEGRYLPWKALFWLPLICATMHISWGLGFLIGLQERPAPPATAPEAPASA